MFYSEESPNYKVALVFNVHFFMAFRLEKKGRLVYFSFTSGFPLYPSALLQSLVFKEKV